jgi:hypothetical protein
MSGDSAGAISDLEVSAADPSWRVQSRLWAWEIAQERGSPGEVALETARLRSAGESTTLPIDRVCIAICLGQMVSADALKEAKTAIDQCYVNYYLGAKALIDGQKEQAITWFKRCIDTRMHNADEYSLASWHLVRLGA